MTKNAIEPTKPACIHQISQQKFIPIIGNIDTDLHPLLIEIIKEGFINQQLNCIEVTLRNHDNLTLIQTLKKEVPGLILGAGTLTSIDQAKTCFDIGVDFYVSPGIESQILNWAKEHNHIYFPGCATASEIMQVLDVGNPYIKMFPASIIGGVAWLQQMSALFPSVQFFCTGGINQDNMHEYLSSPQVLAVGGSSIFNNDNLKDQNATNLLSNTPYLLQKSEEN